MIHIQRRKENSQDVLNYGFCQTLCLPPPNGWKLSSPGLKLNSKGRSHPAVRWIFYYLVPCPGPVKKPTDSVPLNDHLVSQPVFYINHTAWFRPKNKKLFQNKTQGTCIKKKPKKQNRAGSFFLNVSLLVTSYLSARFVIVIDFLTMLIAFARDNGKLECQLEERIPLCSVLFIANYFNRQVKIWMILSHRSSHLEDILMFFRSK